MAYKGLNDAEKAERKKRFVLEKQANTEVTRCRLYKLKTTNLQYSGFMRCFKDARRTYNLVMNYILQNKLLVEDKRDRSGLAAMERECSKQFVGSEGLFRRCPRDRLMLRTPKAVRQQAMKEAIAHIKTHRTNTRKHLEKRDKFPNALAFKRRLKFNPGFKSRILVNDSISFENNSFTRLGDRAFTLYKKLTSTSLFNYALKAEAKRRIARGVLKSVVEQWTTSMTHKMRPTEKNSDPKYFQNVKVAINLPKEMQKDMKIHFKLGALYLIVPYTFRPRTGKRERWVAEEKDAVAAIDPGVRKLFTLYSPQGRVEVIGHNANQVADRRIKRIEKQKRKTKRHVEHTKRQLPTSSPRMKQKLRQSMSKAKKKYRLEEKKARDFVFDHHSKVAHHLCRRYHTVLLPDFNTNSMTNQKGRKINRVVVQRMLFWRFGLFAQRIKDVASYYGTKVLRGSEAYTSKTCAACGYLNDGLGGKEVFTCGSCGATGDRDVLAARNIFIRLVASVVNK